MNKMTKQRILIFLGLTAAFLLFTAAPVLAVIQGITGPTFNLTAKAGSISADDGNGIFMWGFANGAGSIQYPGPTLIVNQNDNVTINLTNQLTVPVSIVFPGQEVTPTGGIPGLLTNEASPGGGTVTYTFQATQPGTYTYYSGTRPELQVELGLFGALIVRPSFAIPSGLTGCAYNHADSCFHREHIFILSEIDNLIHEKVRLGKMGQVDNTDVLPVYWFINGRAGFDTVADNFTPILPRQPYSGLARMHPGERVLVRMIGGGRDLHPFHLHGNHHRTIAKDGRLLKGPTGQDLSFLGFTTAVGPGQTFDAIFSWTGENLGWDIYGTDAALDHVCNSLNVAQAQALRGTNPNDPYFSTQDSTTREFCADHGKPFPVTLPDQKDLTFGPMWSGSPFLGTAGALPPGEGGFNPSAGLFYMWHSHSEKELTSNNIFPGGMLTFGIVEHPSVPIP
jgi:hypothetical protein